jgi:hypothetical protein
MNMELGQALQAYFRGEEELAYGFVVAGVGLFAATWWVARTQSGSFGWALAISFGLVALGLTAGGALFVRHTRSQVAELARRLPGERAALVREESARMARVNANWPRAKLAWVGLGLVGFVLINAVRRDWASAIGLSLLLLATLLSFVDVFGERRAQPYTEALALALREGG